IIFCLFRRFFSFFFFFLRRVFRFHIVLYFIRPCISNDFPWCVFISTITYSTQKNYYYNNPKPPSFKYGFLLSFCQVLSPLIVLYIISYLKILFYFHCSRVTVKA